MPRSHAVPQLTTSGWTDLANSQLDLRSSGLWSYLIKCTTANSKFRVVASNDKNFSISVIDEPETNIAVAAEVAVGGPAFYMFYKVQIIEDAVGGSVEAYGAAK